MDGIIKENDGLSYVYVNRAKAYIKLGYAMKARKDYDKAFELKPDIRKSKDAKNDLAKIDVLQKSGTAKKTAVAVPSKATVKKMETYVSPTIGAKFVLIPAGKFMMGSPPSSESYGIKYHQVSINSPFYIQTTEVTQGQWKKIMGNNPSHFNNCGDNCPVETVSWNVVQEFISKLNSIEGTDKYRLPSEAQWEYAARAGTTTNYYTGDSTEDLSKAGWFFNNSGDKTHPVAMKIPNAWGLYDMHGNVVEFCQDQFREDTRAIRGCHYDSQDDSCYPGKPLGMWPDQNDKNIGFRLVKTQ